MFHGETIKTIKNLEIHQILFYLFLFLLPLQTRTLFHADSAYVSWYFNYNLAFFFYLTDILLIACFTTWLMFDRPNRSMFTKRLFWLILAFFSIILVTLFHVKRLDLGWYETAKWLELLMLMFYVCETFKSKTQYLWAFVVLFICSTIQTTIGLVQFHVQHSLGLGFLGEYIAPMGTSGLATIETATGKIIRAYGTFSHPNVLGAFLVLGLILSLYLLNKADKIQTKLIVSCGTILVFLGIFVTFSRMAWISALIATVCFILYYLSHKQKTTLIAIGIITIVSCGTILGLFHQTLKARVLDTTSTAISNRYFFNNLGLDVTTRYPVLGVGVGNYVEALNDLYKLEPWQTQPAHNIFIFVSTELGILGLILFIMILFEVFSRLKNVALDELTFTLAVLGIIFLMMSQFDHYFVTIQQGRLMFFTVLGLIAALPNINIERDDNKKSD